ncbi:guanine deaminase [Diorhabda carinulata]|uniref:guanine deaminase n=1 Tax=Diorhabda carinulata TaxID=1163345 RepID=UPI0025A0C2C1|nr:guanine deaminase [Diorhabda carinulata]
MTVEDVQIFIGNIIHCKSRLNLEVIKPGFVIVIGSKIAAVGEETELPHKLTQLQLKSCVATRVLKKSQILIPGLIDTHLHAPQYPNCGLGYDKPLLEWLNTYIYELEKQYVDLDFSRRVYKAVVRKTLSNGTTTACYYGCLFNESTNILVDTVVEYGQRALIGKINMTRLAPEEYLETPEDSIANTKKFVKYVFEKESDLVLPIITPRFALSVTMELMKELGQIAKLGDLHIQTHISENAEEVKLVESTYGMPYAQVYDKANLLTRKTILGHGIYLSDEEIKLLVERGTAVSHCPDSNLCLKSGLCNVRKLLENGVKVGLGTDISGGASPSIIKAMKTCLDVSIAKSFHVTEVKPLNYEEVFYLATLGGSEALAMENKIGNFDVHKEFDALIIDMGINIEDYFIGCDPREILQKFIYTGDDRNVASVYVAGVEVK